MIETAGARLRRLIGRGEILAAPGASDPFTARIIERAGFDAVYLGGNALGLSLAKGQPLITLTETADAAAKIARAVEAPVIVDAGAGFGDPAHVHRTVREIESTGAAALHIDDQPYPKRPSYHRGDGGLAPLEVAVARLAVATLGAFILANHDDHLWSDLPISASAFQTRAMSASASPSWRRASSASDVADALKQEANAAGVPLSRLMLSRMRGHKSGNEWPPDFFEK